MRNRLYIVHFFKMGYINIILCAIFLFITKPIYSQDQITIQTPNGTDVPALINFPSLTAAEIQAWYDYMTNNYPDADIIAPPSAQYYCHGYAWHTSETGQEVAIGNSGAQIYFSQEDMSYIEVEEPWIENYWDEVEKIFYSTSGNQHSAIYYSGTYYDPIYDSKWSDGCLVRHDENYCPYFVNYSSIKYYKPNSSVSNDDKCLSLMDNLLITNHPNPFNPSTTISYNLANNIQNPQIEIYNIKGQKLKSYQLEDLIGENSIVWDGKDSNDKPASSGVYFYRLINGGETVQSRKMLMIK